MILVDSSIWADHFRAQDGALSRLLDEDLAVCHPFIIGEILMGRPSNRSRIRSMMESLRQSDVASDFEVLAFVEREELFGHGIGYIDAHLLASTKLTGRCKLWTRDRKMASAARRLNLLADGLPSLQ